MLRSLLLVICVTIAGGSLSACAPHTEPIDVNSNAALSTKSANRSPGPRRVKGTTDCKAKPNYAGMLRTLCYWPLRASFNGLGRPSQRGHWHGHL